jgi:hypothetical protein
MTTPRKPQTDVLMESENMTGKTTEQKSAEAIEHALRQIRCTPGAAWFLGLGSHTWALLTEAHAAITGDDLADVRARFMPISASNPQCSEDSASPRDTFQFIDIDFVRRMDAELKANAHKGDWHAWTPDKLAIFEQLFHHLRKIVRAIRLDDHPRVTEFCADLANISMKAAQTFGDDNDE